MDGLSVAASIIGVIEVAGYIFRLCGGYIQDVKDARADIIALRETINGLVNVLEKLAGVLDDPNSRFNITLALKDDIRTCLLTLEALQEKADPGKGKKAMRKLGFRALKWPMKRSEVERVMDDIKRYESSFSLSLQVDQMAIIIDVAGTTNLIDQNMDLEKLPVAPGAEFDSYMDQHEDECLEGTRTGLQQQIARWAASPQSNCIFWLNGMAGTGKSTISRTVARSFKQNRQLGASFFFKRGEGDRGNATKLFTTLAQQIISMLPELTLAIRKVVQDDPVIATRGLKQQFNKLLLEPLLEIRSSSEGRILVIVIDALDECESEDDIRAILQLIPQLQKSKAVQIRVFLTSRPELPIRLGFSKMANQDYKNLTLHELPEDVTAHDILLFLKHRLAQIGKERSLPVDWPGGIRTQQLLEISVPLFIFAATMCRILNDLQWDPIDSLEEILACRGENASLSRTYLPVFNRLLLNQNEKQKKQLIQEFQDIVGTIVILESPLSIISISALLGISERLVKVRLSSLNSVLSIPQNEIMPVRLFHLSFRDFLLDPGTSKKTPFAIDGKVSHSKLAIRCLSVCSSLKKNICGLQHDGTQRSEIATSRISRCLPLEVQYACRFWAYHLTQGDDPKTLHGVFTFLQAHFLHWMEAMGILGLAQEVVGIIDLLYSWVESHKSNELSEYLQDARRFASRNTVIANEAPLQLYCSGLLFAPKSSIIRKTFTKYLPTWIPTVPDVQENWSADVQSFDDFSGGFLPISFSSDSRTLAYSADDGSIKLWDVMTGVLKHTLEGHPNDTEELVFIFISFSPDGQLLASASINDPRTVKLWDPVAGTLQRTLNHPLCSPFFPTFSPDGRFLVSPTCDPDRPGIFVWDLIRDCFEQIAANSSGTVSCVAFSPDSQLLAFALAGGSVKLWDIASGRLRQTLECHTESITRLSFSHTGQFLGILYDQFRFGIWNIVTGAEKILPGTIYAGIFSPTEQVLVTVSGECLLSSWDPDTGLPVNDFQGKYSPNGLVFSPDGKFLALARDHFQVMVLDMSTGIAYAPFGAHSDLVVSMAFSPNGQFLASGSRDQVVKIWHVGTGIPKPEQHSEGHSSRIRSLTFSADGETFAGCCNDGTVALWYPRTGSLSQKQLLASFPGLDVALAPSGKFLVSISVEKEIKLWRITKSKIEPIPTFQSLNSADEPCGTSEVTFSPCSRMLASHSGGTIQLWDADTTTGSLRLKHTLHYDSEYICENLIFSPNSQLLAARSGDKMLRIWNTRTGSLEKTFPCHPMEICNLEFSPNGRFIASYLLNEGRRFLSLLEISTNEQKQTWRIPGYSERLMFSRDGSYLRTDFGHIDIRPEYWDAPISPGEDVEISIFKSHWVTFNRRKILWLPLEYRPSCFAVHGNILVLGYGSERVLFIEFCPQ
ncbi:NACHT and WD40 domain protein [Penicillium robsamsonii]|uniref:NACHT and WD40 domain protein n=1 Tax=Penicillium robsamsonii TaxID=1792511 RepID=UPI00254720FD|nr:NACHT and WD40 domain protein [Penicillium robsamsonii]KAJ5834216.1 NACHT and WD40 domain protein [Penicillium robsamsonii]